MTTLDTRLSPDLDLRALRRLGLGAQSIAPASGSGSALRRLLVVLDGLAVVIGWFGALALQTGRSTQGPVTWLALCLGLSALSLAFIAGQRLYRARVCTIHAVEINRLGRAMAMSAVVAALVPSAVAIEVPWSFVATGAAMAFALLVVVRAGYRNWLQAGRRHGRFTRPVVVIGANDEGLALVDLLRQHPELGYRVLGVVGRSTDAAAFGVPFLGDISDAQVAVQRIGASGVLIAVSALQGAETNSLVRYFVRNNVHVHLSSGLQGISHTRMRSQPIAHEPLFYVEPLRLAAWQLHLKRAVDLTLGAIVLAFSLPIVGLAALAIKAEDGGAVFFRQRRIGKDGVPFDILKLRTMCEGADLDVDNVRAANERRGGPLFKAQNDPRRTRVGRLLERLSIDELPQLLNVLTGEMSLVGPRPALPREVEQFDDELLGRHAVLPGISGLWQVEARDNPSFAAYRRYDLFYIENWSVMLDVSILVATAQRVLFRGIGLVLGSRQTRPVLTAVPSG